MRRSWPALRAESASRIAGTSGTRCTIRLEGARTRRTPKGNAAMFCWNSMPRSMVSKASYSSRMRRRRSPLSTPAQPRPTTVVALWPSSIATRSRGSCSSRRTRTSQQCSARDLEGGDGLVALDGWELVQEIVESLAAFEIVEQRLHRHARPDEDHRAAENFGIAMYDLAELS